MSTKTQTTTINQKTKATGNKITVIGSRGTGKTTYLAGLAYWPQKMQGDGKGSRFNVEALKDDQTKKLLGMAENLILQGQSTAPTEPKSLSELPYYTLKIQVKHLLGIKEHIFLGVRDYPGGFFDQIQIPDIVRKEYIKECLREEVGGCMILLEKWEPGSDHYYRRLMSDFIDLMDSHNRIGNLRVAIAMSKCERGELWPGRLYPEMDIFDVHLPGTTNTLRGSIPQKNLQFFAISTFGVQERNDPRPNRKDEDRGPVRLSVLREKNKWRPYGMIAPLYWLATGKRINSSV